MSLSVDRIASQIKKELAFLLIKEIKDKQVGYVTVTDVKVTNDLSFATVYYTVMGDQTKIKATDDALNHAKGFIKNEIAKKVQMRKVPEFIFKYDEALEYGNNIEKLLKEIK